MPSGGRPGFSGFENRQFDAKRPAVLSRAPFEALSGEQRLTNKPVALSLLLATAAFAQTPGQAAAPSNEPVPSEVTAAPEADAPMVLGGFDLHLTIFNSSGVYFGSEGYTNSFTLWLEPSFALGKRIAKGRWLEPLTISARVPFEFEVVGSDPRFRGTGFSSPTLFSNPEQLPITQAQQPSSGQVDGTVHQAALIEDTWLSVSHPKLFTVPKLGVVFGGGLRAVLPTSSSSRNAGLITAGSVGVFAEREFGPVEISYAVRPTKYFFSRPIPAISSTPGTFELNGKQEPTWQPGSTGVPNPDWAIVHGLSVDVKLPKGLSVSATYYLFHVSPNHPSTCTVEGVPTANVCLDGPLVGDVRHDAMRTDQWFLASIDWKTPIVTAGLGLSTYRPLQDTNGKLAQPFFVSNRNNYTTVYLSLTFSAEELAQLIRHPEKKP
jgi:hypothetical protein